MQEVENCTYYMPETSTGGVPASSLTTWNYAASQCIITIPTATPAASFQPAAPASGGANCTGQDVYNNPSCESFIDVASGSGLQIGLTSWYEVNYTLFVLVLVALAVIIGLLSMKSD